MLGTVGVVGFLVIWQVASGLRLVNPVHMPPPTTVLPTFATNLAFVEFWEIVGQTMWAWFLGLIMSTVLGIIAGLVIGSVRVLREATHTTIEFLRPIPSIALIPLASLAFGLGLGSELLVVVYGCFWIVLIQVLYGIDDVDKVARETVRTFRMSWPQQVRYLVFPTLLPYLVTGVRLAAMVALILAVSSEVVLGTSGIGGAVNQAKINDDPPAMYSLIITSGVLGIAINVVFRFIERRVLFWHASVRSEIDA